jgi:hypothetical protein
MAEARYVTYAIRGERQTSGRCVLVLAVQPKAASTWVLNGFCRMHDQRSRRTELSTALPRSTHMARNLLSLDITSTTAHSDAMERSARKDAQSQEQEHSALSRTILWLGKLLRQATDDTGAEMSTNGSSADTPEQHSSEPMTISSSLDLVAEKAVDQAITEDKRDAQNRPGSGVGRIFPSLVGGPQRSDRGNLWDPRLRASPDSAEYKQARREMASPPSSLSKEDQEAIRLVNALAPHREDRD